MFRVKQFGANYCIGRDILVSFMHTNGFLLGIYVTVFAFQLNFFKSSMKLCNCILYLNDNTMFKFHKVLLSPPEDAIKLNTVILVFDKYIAIFESGIC